MTHAKLPNLLIIGGMKCGSTTVFRDLESHPCVYFPMDKEPENLCSDDVRTPEGVRTYEALFSGATSTHTVRGEASTAYTKAPTFTGVAQRAHDVLGQDIKLVFIMRDPIARLLSHHRHDGDQGKLPPSPDDAVAQNDELVSFSRYGYQLEQWLDVFPLERFHFIRFEDYTKNRALGFKDLCSFLGLDELLAQIDVDRTYNAAAGKPITTRRWGAVINSPLYKKTIRKLIPRDMKDALRNMLLPKSTFEPTEPSGALLEQLVETFEEDAAHLASLLPNGAPTWDLRSRWLERAEA